MSSVKEPTTEQLVNEDGVLDEKAAGTLIDNVMNSTADESIPAEEPVGEPPSEEPQDKATVDDKGSDGEGWVSTDDIKELVESLGYSPEDMAEFETQEEFERHVRFMDRELVNRSERTRPGDEQERALAADEIYRQKDGQRKQAEGQHRENGRFAKAPEGLPQLDPGEWDDELVNALEARDAKIAELEAMVNEIRSSSENDIVSDFDSIVDDVAKERGLEDLLGNSDDLRRSDIKEREQLFEAFKVIYNGMEVSGKQVKGKKALRGMIVRALNYEFAETLQQQQRRELTSKAKRQSSRKTGSSRRTADRKYDGPAHKDPALLEAFKQMESENGG